MIWLEGFDLKEMFKEKPFSSSSCLSCGRKVYFYTDLPPREYRIKCSNCNHILHVRIKEREE